MRGNHAPPKRKEKRKDKKVKGRIMGKGEQGLRNIRGVSQRRTMLTGRTVRKAYANHSSQILRNLAWESLRMLGICSLSIKAFMRSFTPWKGTKVFTDEQIGLGRGSRLKKSWPSYEWLSGTECTRDCNGIPSA